MPDLFYFNRHFHSMQAGILVGTFLQKMETIFVKVVSCEEKLEHDTIMETEM